MKLEQLIGKVPRLGQKKDTLTMGVSWIKDYQLDFEVYLKDYDMPLQRGLVWSTEQKQGFIKSILQRSYIPRISVIEYVEGDFKRLEIIDGKQRINAVLAFLRGEFPILDVEGNPHFYAELPKEIQLGITKFHFDVNINYYYPDEPISDKDKIEWFQYLNFTGTVQDYAHMEKLKSKLNGN